MAAPIDDDSDSEGSPLKIADVVAGAQQRRKTDAAATQLEFEVAADDARAFRAGPTSNSFERKKRHHNRPTLRPERASTGFPPRRKRALRPFDLKLEEEQTAWAKLKDRRSAVVSLLRSVCDQLRAINNPPLSREAEAEGTTWAAQHKRSDRAGTLFLEEAGTPDGVHRRIRRYAGATRKDWVGGPDVLSWRGKELAQTLFDAIDTRSRGAWSYSDFRRYLEAVGRPFEFEKTVLESREAWRCYVRGPGHILPRDLAPSKKKRRSLRICRGETGPF